MLITPASPPAIAPSSVARTRTIEADVLGLACAGPRPDHTARAGRGWGASPKGDPGPTPQACARNAADSFCS